MVHVNSNKVSTLIMTGQYLNIAGIIISQGIHLCFNILVNIYI